MSEPELEIVHVPLDPDIAEACRLAAEAEARARAKMTPTQREVHDRMTDEMNKRLLFGGDVKSA